MANRDARPGPAAKAGSWASTLWLMVVIGLLLAGGFFLWTGDTRRGTQQPLYSVHRTDDRGAALVYRLYAEAGLKPGAWDEPLTRLKEPGMLILLEPARASYFNVGGGDGIETGREGELFPDEVKALDDWVKQGNVAVIMARQYNDLYHALGLIVDEPKGVSGTAATPAQPGVLAQGVAALQTQTSFGFKYGRKKPQAGPQVKGGGANAEDEEEPPSEAPVPQVPAEEWLELFVKKDGARSVPQVVTAARGKGLYVAVNDVFPAENIGLTTADNARFMLNLAALRPPGSAIWFDEYHKRAADRGFMTYLRERSLLPALVYVLLLVGLVLWRTGVRFGAPEPLVADRRRDSGEYVRAVAALYRNAKMSRQALSTIYGDFRRRMTGALRMDGLTDLDEVGRRYEMRTGRPALEARQVLIETEAALAREKLDEAEALQFCARLTQLDSALHRHSGTAGGNGRKGRRGEGT